MAEPDMYLPESHKQMFDILSDLRLYAAMNELDGLAERLDDALVVLTVESKKTQPGPKSRASTLAPGGKDGY